MQLGRMFIFSNPESVTTRSLVPIDLQTGLLESRFERLQILKGQGFAGTGSDALMAFEGALEDDYKVV